MSEVVARPQVDTGPATKSTRPYRRNTPRLGGNASHIPERREVEMIFKGPHKVGSGWRERDRYTQKVKKLPQAMVPTISFKHLASHAPQLDDIVFTKANVS